MRPARLFSRLFALTAGLIFFTFLLMLLLSLRVQDSFVRKEERRDLEALTRLVAQDVQGQLGPQDRARLAEYARSVDRFTGFRVTIIAPDGSVVADSQHDPSQMENHGHRPEVAAALSGHVGADRRHSATVGREMLYVAVPIRQGDRVEAAARAALAEKTVQDILRPMHERMLVSVLALLPVAALLSFAISRRISRPIAAMRRAADAYARGDLDQRVPSPDIVEFEVLARTLNGMAAALKEKLRTIGLLLDEQKAIFASMSEGLIVIDPGEHVQELNEAAARMIGVGAAAARGRTIQEVLRHPALQALVTRLLSEGRSSEEHIVVHGPPELSLQARVTPLRASGGEALGALVVLMDITRLRKLETTQRDFVANVSHEMKTPVTSIRGFAETLASEASTENGRRFADIIVRQAGHLERLIEDLLDLARIEHAYERGGIARKAQPLLPILESAVDACAEESSARSIQVSVACDPALEAAVDANLLERAVANLVENGIKYSSEGGGVRVEAAHTDGTVEIRVCDQGCGIAPEHHARIFDRFYRVDKGRSRALGGTGLGLAIVQFVARAHGGSVRVESAPGQGSTFTVTLPSASRPL
jgi:two-component system, OmpR family, phosphate regulon sensor histidine kinase PhoR